MEIQLPANASLSAAVILDFQSSWLLIFGTRFQDLMNKESFDF